MTYLADNTRNQAKPTSWRADIDGLRGISIVLVVIFHMAPGLFPAGFLGVDVFFVISGYVITHAIYPDLEANSFSWWAFFLRRLRRLLPSLLFVLGLAYLVSIIFLYDDELKRVGEHGLYSLFFLQNFNLMSGHEYFSENWYVLPFQHIWSLAVEEQFYIIFAAICSLSVRSAASERSFKLFITAIFLTSLIALIFNFKAISTDYYNPFFRFWELTAGCLTYLLARRYVFLFNVGLANVLFVLGGGLLVIALMLIDKTSEVPGPVLIIPVLGACALLLSWRSRFSSSTLGNKFVVMIGRLSYAWYLLHWPFLSFYRIIAGANPSPIEKLVLVLSSLVLSAFVTIVLDRKSLVVYEK